MQAATPRVNLAQQVLHTSVPIVESQTSKINKAATSYSHATDYLAWRLYGNDDIWTWENGELQSLDTTSQGINVQLGGQAIHTGEATAFSIWVQNINTDQEYRWPISQNVTEWTSFPFPQAGPGPVHVWLAADNGNEMNGSMYVQYN